MYKNLKSYQTAQASVQTPGRMILVIYESLIASLNKAIHCINSKDYPAAHKHLTKSKLIVSELTRAIDDKVGGELGPNLKRMYNYIYDCLLDANINKETKKIEESVKLLTNVYEGWKIAVKQQPSGITSHSRENQESRLPEELQA